METLTNIVDLFASLDIETQAMVTLIVVVFLWAITAIIKAGFSASVKITLAVTGKYPPIPSRNEESRSQAIGDSFA